MNEEEYMVQILNYIKNTKDEYYDFYKESRNWLFNTENKEETIKWIELTDIDKKNILDKELWNYFN